MQQNFRFDAIFSVLKKSQILKILIIFPKFGEALISMLLPCLYETPVDAPCLYRSLLSLFCETVGASCLQGPLYVGIAQRLYRVPFSVEDPCPQKLHSVCWGLLQWSLSVGVPCPQLQRARSLGVHCLYIMQGPLSVRVSSLYKLHSVCIGAPYLQGPLVYRSPCLQGSLSVGAHCLQKLHSVQGLLYVRASCLLGPFFVGAPCLQWPLVCMNCTATVGAPFLQGPIVCRNCTASVETPCH